MEHLIIDIDEKKQRKLYNEEFKKIDSINTWHEAMESYGRITYFLSLIEFKKSAISLMEQIRLQDKLEEKVSDRRRKCSYYKAVEDFLPTRRVLDHIDYNIYFANDYEVGKNAEFKKAKDGGYFIKGFLDMAKKLGDKRKEEEITAPFLVDAEEYKTQKEKEAARKEKIEELQRENKAKEEAAGAYFTELAARAQTIIRTGMIDNTSLHLLDLEELGYNLGLFSLIAETTPQLFICAGMSDAYFALKINLPKEFWELTTASTFVYLDEGDTDDFRKGFRKGLNTTIAAYPDDWTKATIIEELKKIGKHNIKSNTYDGSIYNYLHQIGKIS